MQVFLLSRTSRRAVINDEKVKQLPVVVIVVKYAFGWLTVSARSSALLHVAFK